MNLADRLTLTDARRTADGYLTANAKVARTGIQEYAGWELGKNDAEVIRVYRPEDEVFDVDAMKSIAHRPITNNHPNGPVTADNWRSLAVGNIGDEIARDGENIRVPLALMDAGVINDVEGGKRELSLGYACDIDWTPGVTDGGLQYDAIQRNIRVNHLAVVDKARGGLELKIGDSGMTTRKLTIDGIEIEVADAAHSIVTKLIADRDTKIADLESSVTKAQTDAATGATSLATKDAEIATLKSQLDEANDPAKLDAAANMRADAITKAKAIIGDKLVTDGRSTPDIRKQVVAAKLGDVAKDWTDDQIAASFNTLTATTKDAKGDPIVTAFSNQNMGDKRQQAHDAMIARMKNPRAESEQTH